MWMKVTKEEVCKELCEKRIYYEELILKKPTISLEKCVRTCIANFSKFRYNSFVLQEFEEGR